MEQVSSDESPVINVRSQRKMTSLTVVSVILTALLVGGGVYAYQYRKQQTLRNDLQVRIDDLEAMLPTVSSTISTPAVDDVTGGTTPSDDVANQNNAASVTTAPVDPTAGWQTYINTKYGYRISYPIDWRVTEFPDTETGAYLRLASMSTNDAPLITIDCLAKPTDYASMPLKDYEKIAAIQEIEGYTKLLSSKTITTTSGITGYQNTWRRVSMRGEVSVSNPITYFQPHDTARTVQVRLEDAKYADVYTTVVNSFQQ